jgi:nitroimidazol reductase NimA-like FMN-containing flavoprotein (pyridoxamine 5'-phosphate oxidase superfamily)
MAERGRYDIETIHAIIDAAWYGHVAFADGESVHCIPMACWRHEEVLYLHGSNGGRIMKALAGGTQVCVTITHLDGLVLARSAFHHSMNYRSAIIYGRCQRVAEQEKPAALEHFMRHIATGREREARPGDRNELAATQILQIPITEAAAKIREGGPLDDEADMSLPVWAGVLPVRQEHLPPEPDAACTTPTPDYVRAWTTAPD